MIFEEGGIYHIYNQGNNRRVVFFSRDNYLFFLKKIRQHVTPYADVLAWCLMPNHFHLMAFVRSVQLGSQGLTLSQTLTSVGAGYGKNMDFNFSIGKMQGSYTRAINIQQGFSGSLFRKGTKAICLNEVNGVSPSWQAVQGAFRLNVCIPEREYPQVCFNYLHNNPVAAGLVTRPEGWEFSSFRDYAGLRDGKLISRARAVELGLQVG